MALSPTHTQPAPQPHGGGLIERWRALHEKSGLIAQMADLSPEPIEPVSRRFEDALLSTDQTGQRLVQRAMEDIELLAEIGLKALREVEARDQATHAPALALWREFYHSREALLTVLEPAAA